MVIKEDPHKIYLEIGQKKVFAVSANWPDWTHSGRGESSAIQSLWKSTPRYAKVLSISGLKFNAPESSSAFIIMDRLKGNATTDFSAPDAQLSDDWEPIEDKKIERFKVILYSCWQAFVKPSWLPREKNSRKALAAGAVIWPSSSSMSWRRKRGISEFWDINLKDW
jgi:hypothetical protein